MATLDDILDDKGHELHVVSPEATVTDAADHMYAAHVGALLVMNGDRLEGVFSERDLLRRVIIARRDPMETLVHHVMTRNVIVVPHTFHPHDAMAIMTTRRVRHLPVVDERQVVGLVSIGDLIRWSLHDRDIEIEQLYDYIAGRYPG
jgi:signal-transduction protein with cAMP-binding, CBS, and nucleotidyltransferase domain